MFSEIGQINVTQVIVNHPKLLSGKCFASGVNEKKFNKILLVNIIIFISWKNCLISQ